MEESKPEELETKNEQELEARKLQDVKNDFTTIYILVGIVIIAILSTLLYALLIS